MLTRAQKKLLFLSSLGGILEFYDFIIYALLASYISQEFFPTATNISSLMATFATFSLGYLVRPLGGLVFGHFGDKFGRKKTFTYSIFLMDTATFCIGLVPSYATIGIAAPVILTLLRILQGLSIGAEIPGAIAYVSESIPDKKGFACGVIFFSLNSGIVLGSLIHATLNMIFTNPQMLTWGWRIPFFIGGIFGLFSCKLRGQLEESRLFRLIEDKTEKYPIITVLKNNLTSALSGIFIVGLGASIINLLFLFTPSYLSNVLQVDTHHYSWFNTGAIFLAAFLNMIFGIVADKVNHKFLLYILAFATIIFAYPIFFIYVNHFNYSILALLLSAALTGLAFGVIPAVLAELFPTNIRYSGIALSYNLGFAIFGGLTPLIAMSLIYLTTLTISPSFYLIFSAVLALFAVLFIFKTFKLSSSIKNNLI